jgi:putative membrane protein
MVGGDMMMGGGMAWMMWLFWIPILVLIVGLVVLVVVLLARRPGGAMPDVPEPPMQILKRRLASGEIDSKQFREMKRDLGEG